MNPARSLYHNSLKPFLILFSYLRTRLPNSPFLSGFPTKTRYFPSKFLACHMPLQSIPLEQICTLLITNLTELIAVKTWQLQKRDANCRLCPWEGVKRSDRREPDNKHRNSGTVAGKNMVSRGFCWVLLGAVLVCWAENIQVRDFINMVRKCNFEMTFVTYNSVTIRSQGQLT